LGHQIYTVILLVVIAWLASVSVDWGIQNNLLAFLISGLIYTVGVMLLLVLFPTLIFISRAELQRQLTQLKLKIQGS
jgi:hypothetical protein